jgi:hypothetical protein
VAVSIDTAWLAHYYLRQDRKRDALRIARANASVGSAGGLDTLANVLEKTEQWDEAEAYFERSASTPSYLATASRISPDPGRRSVS